MADEKGKILKLLKLDKLFENLTGYIETQIELVKLDMKEQAHEGAEKMFHVIILLFLFSFVILFISFGISILLNAVTNTTYGGYLIVASVYLVLFVFIATDKQRRIGKWLTSLVFSSKN